MHPMLDKKFSANASRIAIVLVTSARVAGSNAAKPMTKMTNLNVKGVLTACRISGLILLFEA